MQPTSLLIHRPGLVRPFQHYYHRGNNHHPHRHGSPVMFRTSHVKTTSTRNYINPSLSNTVLPPVTKVAQPKPKARTTTTRPEELNLPLPQAYKSPVKSLKTLRKKAAKGEKKTGKRVTKNQTRRRRTGGMTVAHYVAQASEKTNGINNEGWTQAVWMDKLGLDKKYHLKRGAVIVKEAGLYYIYAQLLYKTGRFGTGYQVMVDSVPIMECSITQASPSDSCHTSGVTYLPSNAEIQVRNKESFMSPVDQTRNSFFGLIKLMDAPSTTEELMGTQ
ncbi:unnamed protein product [Meganyctiphanes norvegica]|uniref:THD domain-containing protein n=1 Tax=Meganyctiphanes norvegica TaxID=48144 RepID=A0AAV2RE97_MEGNR